MALDYNTFPDQLAALLKIARKYAAVWEHSHLNSNADYNKRLVRNVFTDTVEEEAEAEGGALSTLPSLASAASAAFQTARNILDLAMEEVIKADITLSDEDEAAGTISYEYDQSLAATGQVKIKRRLGIYGALYHQMVTDSKKIKKNAVTFGGLTAKSTNVGKMVFGTSPTGMDHSLSGVARLKVVNDPVGSVDLSLRLELTTPLADGTEIINADRTVRLGKDYEDGQTGLKFKLDLDSVTETDPDSLISGVTITNPSGQDSDEGIHYLKFTRQGSGATWLIEWFRRDARKTTHLVQSTTATGTTGTDPIDMTGGGGTRFQFTYHKANANGVMANAGDSKSDVKVDINSPREKEEWTFTVTNDKAGNFATKLAECHRVSLNSDAAASAEFDDTKAASISMS